MTMRAMPKMNWPWKIWTMPTITRIAAMSQRTSPMALARFGGPLAGLLGLGLGPGALGLGFLLGDVTLGVGLVLLGLALGLEAVVAGDGAGRFLDLALDALDDALHACFGTGFVVSHGVPRARARRTSSPRVGGDRTVSRPDGPARTIAPLSYPSRPGADHPREGRLEVSRARPWPW